MAGWVVDIGMAASGPFITESLNGVRRTIPTWKTELANRSGIANNSLMTAEFCLSDLLPTDASDQLPHYLKEIAQAQTIYVLVREGKRLYIPIQVIASALVPLKCYIFREIWSAAGLDGVVDILQNPELGTLGAYRSEGQGRTIETSEHLIWLACFPSARRMVGSFHMSVLEGKLHIELPSVKASVEFFGRTFGSASLVHHCRVDWVEPDERPFPVFAKGLPKRLRLASKFPVDTKRKLAFDWDF